MTELVELGCYASLTGDIEGLRIPDLIVGIFSSFDCSYHELNISRTSQCYLRQDQWPGIGNYPNTTHGLKEMIQKKIQPLKECLSGLQSEGFELSASGGRVRYNFGVATPTTYPVAPQNIV
jgi:hypothetical protein